MGHVLVILGLAAAWVVFVYVSPTRACRSCARHRGPCPRCRGTGRRFRVGAGLVRRATVHLYREVRQAVHAHREARR